ncbi:hypothetical protein EC988_006357, partial [Linderina pennispora]
MSYGQQSSNYNIVVDVDDDEPTLEFQDYATTQPVQQGRMNAASSAPYQAPATGGSDSAGYSVWRVEYWAQYFNVDSSDVVQRA